jgi:hypothetical protein
MPPWRADGSWICGLTFSELLISLCVDVDLDVEETRCPCVVWSFALESGEKVSDR